MDTDTPSHQGREDLPSELGFALAPRQTDPTPVCDASERGKSPGIDLCYGHKVKRTGGPRNKRRTGSTIRTGNRNATGTGSSKL